MARVGRSVGRMAGQWLRAAVRPEMAGPVPSLLGFPAPALWKMQVRRRAERVSRPAREKNRRRNAQTDGAVQRARLWAITASQAPLAAKRPEGDDSTPRRFEPDGILDLGRRWSASSSFSVPVGDAAVIAVGGEEGPLGTGRRLHPPDDEPRRRGVRVRKGV